MRSLAVCLALICACQDPPPSGGGGAASGTPTTTASAETKAASSAAPVASAAPAGSASGPATSLGLAGGGKLVLPAGATAAELKSSALLPKEVQKSHLYQLGDPKRLLFVGELERGQKGCGELIDAELEKVKKAQADTDPTRKELRRVGKVETFDVGDARALYVEGQQRGLGRAEERPFAATASLTLCTPKDAVVAIYASTAGELGADVEPMLKALAKSYAAP